MLYIIHNDYTSLRIDSKSILTKKYMFQKKLTLFFIFIL